MQAYRHPWRDAAVDKKSEEELERIANLVTAEMIRDLDRPKADGETDESDPGADREEA
jgi:hypothetical protein